MSFFLNWGKLLFWFIFNIIQDWNLWKLGDDLFQFYNLVVNPRDYTWQCWILQLFWEARYRDGLSRWHSGKGSTFQFRRCKFNPWDRKIFWRRKWQPTPVLLPGESHGQKSLAGYSPWGRKESDTTACIHEDTEMEFKKYSVSVHLGQSKLFRVYHLLLSPMYVGMGAGWKVSDVAKTLPWFTGTK